MNNARKRMKGKDCIMKGKEWKDKKDGKTQRKEIKTLTWSRRRPWGRWRRRGRMAMKTRTECEEDEDEGEEDEDGGRGGRRARKTRTEGEEVEDGGRGRRGNLQKSEGKKGWMKWRTKTVCVAHHDMTWSLWYQWRHIANCCQSVMTPSDMMVPLDQCKPAIMQVSKQAANERVSHYLIGTAYWSRRVASNVGGNSLGIHRESIGNPLGIHWLNLHLTYNYR